MFSRYVHWNFQLCNFFPLLSEPLNFKERRWSLRRVVPRIQQPRAENLPPTMPPPRELLPEWCVTLCCLTAAGAARVGPRRGGRPGHRPRGTGGGMRRRRGGGGAQQRGGHTQPRLQVGELGVAQHLQDAVGREAERQHRDKDTHQTVLAKLSNSVSAADCYAEFTFNAPLPAATTSWRVQYTECT